MSKPLTFSVGIPAYNQGEFLEETIQSLLNQTRPPDEIVVSDHFSTDNTPDIIAKYAGKVRGVKPPEGANVGQQWQYTLSCLSGDWVTLFSSDDIAYPNFVEVLLRGASRRDDAVLVRAGWQNIDKQGAVHSQHFLMSVKQICVPPETLLEQKLGPKASFAAFAVLRDAMQASGGYPLTMESFGDWPMFVQLSPFGSFIYENELIAGYRVGHDGNKLRKRLDLWLRDGERMFYEVFPLAADRLGLIDRSWIEKASREYLLRYLASSSREFSPAERVSITPMFQHWAERVGCEKELHSFAEGHVVTPASYWPRRAKKLIRPYAQKVKSFLRNEGDQHPKH